MNCPNCHQATEEGAAFCGNCGQALLSAVPAAAPTASIAAAGVPAYALAKPGQHTGETKALLALLFGVAGVVGAVFIALVGLLLGVAGIIMGTMSRSSSKRGLSTAGLIFSSLAILVSLAVWTYAIRHDPRFNQSSPPAATSSAASPAVSADGLSTPCYTAGFVNKLNVSNNADSCDMNAFNGATLSTSSDAYKVYADTSQTVNDQNYASVFKPAIEQDVKDNLPGFTVDSELASDFAGSPAYVVNASDSVHKVAVVEAAVFHRAGPGENVFILVHAVNGQAADLTALEAQWQWK